MNYFAIIKTSDTLILKAANYKRKKMTAFRDVLKRPINQIPRAVLCAPDLEMQQKPQFGESILNF